MRYIKRQSTSKSNLAGAGVHYTSTGEIILDSTNVMLVPKGDTSERPFYFVEGHLRYNTDTEEFEVFQGGAWRNLRFKEPNRNPGIVRQTFSGADGIIRDFGPLNSGDPDYPIPAAAQNILVFVENVYQIPNTNYELKQLAGGWFLRFGTAVPYGKDVTVIHNFDK